MNGGRTRSCSSSFLLLHRAAFIGPSIRPVIRSFNRPFSSPMAVLDGSTTLAIGRRSNLTSSRLEELMLVAAQHNDARQGGGPKPHAAARVLAGDMKKAATGAPANGLLAQFRTTGSPAAFSGRRSAVPRALEDASGYCSRSRKVCNFGKAEAIRSHPFARLLKTRRSLQPPAPAPVVIDVLSPVRGRLQPFLLVLFPLLRCVSRP